MLDLVSINEELPLCLLLRVLLLVLSVWLHPNHLFRLSFGVLPVNYPGRLIGWLGLLCFLLPLFRCALLHLPEVNVSLLDHPLDRVALCQLQVVELLWPLLQLVFFFILLS